MEEIILHSDEGYFDFFDQKFVYAKYLLYFCNRF